MLSQGLSWAFFQQMKKGHSRSFRRPATDIENFVMGSAASAITVCIMMPAETVKTRIVTQAMYPNIVPYNGMLDGFSRIMSEEGFRTLYLGLTPRLASVVPMMGIQFGMYELMKRTYLEPQRSQTTD